MDTSLTKACPKEREVLTSGINSCHASPGICGYMAMLYRYCLFYKKMSLVWHSCVALVLPQPSFPCVPGAPSVWDPR